MRLAILHSGDLQGVSPGGVDRYVKSIITGFLGDEVTLFGTTKRSTGMLLGERYEMSYEGVVYCFVPISYDDKIPLCVYYAKNLPKYFVMLRGYDCVYAQRIEYALPFAFSPIKHRLIQLIHGSSAYSEIGFGKKVAAVYPLFEKAAIGIAARTYIVLNRDEFGVPYYKRLYPQYAAKLHYGKNPIDCAFLESADRFESRQKLGFGPEKIISFIGRVSDNPKRVLSLPEICRRTIETFPSIRFVVVGDGDDLEELKRRTCSAGVENNFLFAGYVSDPETIRDYLVASDATISISHFEGTCTSVLESLACGVPVLSTDVGDIHEVLIDDENGIIIRNDSATVELDAANALVSMLSKPPKMGNQYKKYDLPAVVKELRMAISGLKGK